MNKNLFELAQVIHNGPHGGNSKYSVDTIASLIQKYVNDKKKETNEHARKASNS